MSTLTLVSNVPLQSVTALEVVTSFGAAFVGGALLNLMPCVFPMLAIKVLSLVRQAGTERAHVRAAGLLYSAGVLVTFVGLFGLLQALRQSGASIGWGFQLQSPAFVGALVVVFYLLTLHLFGLVNIELPARFVPAGLASKSGLAGEFFAGVLAVFVASPCTAPFMAPAVGFALAQPILVGLCVFTGLALGFAFPFLLLCFFPKSISILPKPGAWMESFKEFLAFPLALACIWLLWVFSRQTSPEAVAFVLLTLLCLGFALWALKRKRMPSFMRSLTSALAVVAAIGCGWGALSQLKPQALAKSDVGSASSNASPNVSGTNNSQADIAATNEAWKPFSPELVAQLTTQGKTVFVDYTADWCVTCKVNEKTVLDSEAVRAAVKAHDVVLVKADWTNDDPVITRSLESFGRSGVPLYVVYKKGQDKPEVLPQILTNDLVIRSISP